MHAKDEWWNEPNLMCKEIAELLEEKSEYDERYKGANNGYAVKAALRNALIRLKPHLEKVKES